MAFWSRNREQSLLLLQPKSWRDRSRSSEATLATCGNTTATAYMGDAMLEAWNAACRKDRGGLMSGKACALLYGTGETALKGRGFGGDRKVMGRLVASVLALRCPPCGAGLGSPASSLALGLGGFGVPERSPRASAEQSLCK